MFEGYKKFSREQGKSLVDNFISQAFAFGPRVIPIDLELTILASGTSLETRLPMADAIIYASAQRHKAQLITSYVHFINLPGVIFV